MLYIACCNCILLSICLPYTVLYYIILLNWSHVTVFTLKQTVRRLTKHNHSDIHRSIFTCLKYVSNYVLYIMYSLYTYINVFMSSVKIHSQIFFHTLHVHVQNVILYTTGRRHA
jgi:hypothetical protein